MAHPQCHLQNDWRSLQTWKTFFSFFYWNSFYNVACESDYFREDENIPLLCRGADFFSLTSLPQVISSEQLSPKVSIEFHPTLLDLFIDSTWSLLIKFMVLKLRFSLVLSGLEDQLLALVVAEERPDLEEAKNQLIVSNAKMRQELKEIEDKILHKLSASEGSPVDDIDLIHTLEQSKAKSLEIKVTRKRFTFFKGELLCISCLNRYEVREMPLDAETAEAWKTGVNCRETSLLQTLSVPFANWTKNVLWVATDCSRAVNRKKRTNAITHVAVLRVTCQLICSKKTWRANNAEIFQELDACSIRIENCMTEVFVFNIHMSVIWRFFSDPHQVA